MDWQQTAPSCYPSYGSSPRRLLIGMIPSRMSFGNGNEVRRGSLNHCFASTPNVLDDLEAAWNVIEGFHHIGADLAQDAAASRTGACSRMDNCSRSTCSASARRTGLAFCSAAAEITSATAGIAAHVEPRLLPLSR
jgi:hypothetical protein